MPKRIDHTKPKAVAVHIRLEESLNRQGLKRAAEEGRTMSGLLRWALIQYLSTPQEGGK